MLGWLCDRGMHVSSGEAGHFEAHPFSVDGGLLWIMQLAILSGRADV